MYLAEGLSAKQIGDLLGCNRDTVNAWLRRYEIPLRSKEEATTLRCKGRTSPMKGRRLTDDQRKRKLELWADPEYRRHMSEVKRGAGSSLWKGGVASESNVRLARSEWIAVRNECYVRDRGICCDCGVKCLTKKEVAVNGQTHRLIQAHHVIPRRHGGLDELSNLVTLCVRCHHKREWRWRDALFQ